MGAINIKHTGSGADVTLSSDGTDLLLDGTAVGGSALELYAENPSSPTAPSATGTNAVAIGSNTEATGDRSMALVEGANATALRAFAVGFNTTASGFNSVAMGSSAVASASGAFALGPSTDATSINSIAIGHNAQTATGASAVAIGQSYASGTDSFAAAIATNSSSYGATGASSVAIGDRAKATATRATAIGTSVTASQADGAVAMGSSSTASGLGSFATGYLNIASGHYSQAIGYGASTASIYGKFAKSSGYFSNYADMQTGILVLVAATTDATPKALTSNKAAAGTTNQIILPNNSAYSFSGTIIARESATDGSDYASWEIKGALLRDANAASTVLGNGIVNKLYSTAGASTWSIALTADTTNGGLKIEVTGAAATNIRWVATVHTSEVTYA